ncbi:hypothetical protein [Leucobacter sp. 1207-22]|uniref:hypothetical protein n=1 Tax=Leucobacter sp. 1207-22 TaxID=2604456 RepID=UPI0040642F66
MTHTKEVDEMSQSDNQTNHRRTMTQATDALEWRELTWLEVLSPDQITTVLERFATAPELVTLILEFRADDRGACWLLGTQPHRIPAIRDALVSHLPVRLNTPRKARSRMEDAATVTVVGGHLLGAATVRVSTAVRALYGTVSQLQEGERVTLQLQLLLGRLLSPRFCAGPGYHSWLDLLLGGQTPPRKSSTTSAATEARERHGFQASLRIGATGTPARTRFLIRQVFGSLRTIETSEARLRLSAGNPVKLNEARLPWRWPIALRSSELAAFTGWPAGEAPLPLIGSIHPCRSTISCVTAGSSASLRRKGTRRRSRSRSGTPRSTRCWLDRPAAQNRPSCSD